ncbi:MAG: HDOD domain-containing protein [Bdellovibrionota bacterium]
MNDNSLQNSQENNQTYNQEEFKTEHEIAVDWREILTWVDDLPPMPHVASKVINLLSSPNTTSAELNEFLKKDTALSSKILKIANSALFSRQREITGINQAVMLIGFQALKGIVVAATIRQMNQTLSSIQKIIWDHSIATAMFSTNISKSLKKPYSDEMFLFGMLHSLGHFVILNYNETKNRFKDVMNLIKENSCDYCTAEQEIFGFTHPLIGALVAKKWNFSAEICQIVLHYASSLESFKEENVQTEKTLILKLSDILSHTLKLGSPEGYKDLTNDIVPICKLIGFNKDTLNEDLQNIVELTEKQYEAEKSIY